MPRFLLGAGGQRGERVHAVGVERAARDRVPRTGRQSQGGPQIMQCEQPEPEKLLLVDQVTNERAREVRAGRAAAALLEGPGSRANRALRRLSRPGP